MKDFLSTVTHPNRKALAEKLLSGTPPEELYGEHGKSAVLSMQGKIEAFNAMPAERQANPRAIENAGCRACRRKQNCD